MHKPHVFTHSSFKSDNEFQSTTINKLFELTNMNLNGSLLRDTLKNNRSTSFEYLKQNLQDC